MTTFVTAQESTQSYWTKVQSLNPNLDPSQEGTDFWAKGLAIGNMISGLSQTISLVEQNLFPQTATGGGIDKQLASWGQVPRMGSLPATGTAKLVAVPSSNFTISAGTALTYPATNQVFIVQADTAITIAGGANQTFPIESQTLGTGTAIPANSVLNFSSPVGGYSQATCVSMADGSAVESDLSCSARLLTAIQQPRLGGTIGDYETWALSIANVTGATAIKDLYIIGSLSLIVLSGSDDYDVILETPPSVGDVYTRTANSDTLSEVSQYISTQDPAGANVFIATATTQMVASSGTPVTVEVVLAEGLSLTTVMPVGLTVLELIQREIRRAVITAPIRGNVVNGSSYILLSDIEQTLDVGLSAGNNYQGVYGSILVDRTVTYDGGNNNILLSQSPNSAGNYPFVYDIYYGSMDVSES